MRLLPRLTFLLVLLASLGLLLLGCGRPRGGGGSGFNSDDDDDDQASADDDDDGAPNGADSDGDGVSDADEEDLGTDPDDVDSDGDGYEDGWEVDEGSDPTDADEGIYQGGWPYNPDKDDMDEGSFGSPAVVNGPVPRLIALDQYGEMVDLFDLAGAGVPMIIDLSAESCGPCQQMAAWLAGANNGFIDSAGNPLREAVWNGDLLWVTIMLDDMSGNPANLATLERWHDAYETPNVPVLADNNYQFTSIINPPGIPSLTYVSADFTFLIIDDSNAVLNAAFGDI